MANVKWSKEVALEIIKVGYIRATKKYHPDLGGSHDEMLVLTATKEHLEKLLAGAGSQTDHRFDNAGFGYPGWDRQKADRAQQQKPKEPPFRRRRSKFWDDFEETQKSNPDIPIEPYPHERGYSMLVDVTVMSKTEKAIKIKIPGVSMPQWLPFSQLHIDSNLHHEAAEGDVGTVVFTNWIAKQKGWLK